MSHLATIKVQIKDLDAVKAACAEFGWTFKEGQAQFNGMGWKNKCAHAIALPGVPYEVGLIPNEDGNGYTLGFDEYLAKDIPHWNGGKSYLGEGASKLLQLYGVHKAQIEAKKRGLLFTRKQVGSKIQCTVSGM